jgi:alpha-N-arabinofuranosidase
MGASRYFEDYINTEIALCDFVQAKMRSPRKLMISFDEYAIMMRQPSENLHYGRAPYERLSRSLPFQTLPRFRSP